MSLPITTPEIITHLTGLKNLLDFSCTHIDSTTVYISEWFSDADQPTDAEILAAQDEVEALIKSKEYIEKRKAEYPSVGDQLDMLMKDMRDGTTTHKDACEAVKAKFPKPE